MLENLENLVNILENQLSNMTISNSNLIIFQKKMIKDLKNREIDQNIIEELVASINFDIQGIYNENYGPLFDRLIIIYGKIIEDYYQEIIGFVSSEVAVKAFMLSMTNQMKISI